MKRFLALALSLSLAAPASAQTFTWTGAVLGNNAWNGFFFPNTNWFPSLIPPNEADVVFSAFPTNGLLAINLNGDRTVNSFTINSGFGWSYGGGTLTLTSGNLTRTNFSALQPEIVFSTPIVQGGSGTWNIDGANGVTVTGALKRERRADEDRHWHTVAGVVGHDL